MKIPKERRDYLVASGKFDYFMATRLDLLSTTPELIYKTTDKYDRTLNPAAFPELTEEELPECQQLYENRKRRQSTLSERLYYWSVLRKDVETYFFTFTFSDKTLENTSPDYRKKALERLLKPICLDYSLNIDHGNKTEREHYHGFMVLERGKYPRKPIKATNHKGKAEIIWRTDALNGYKMGSYTLKEIKPKNKDIKKVSSYIDKVTNHALKKSAGDVAYMAGTEYHEFKKLRDKLDPEVYEWTELKDKVIEIERKIVEITHNEEAPKYLYRANFVCGPRKSYLCE